MSASDLLELVRSGDLETLGERRAAVADAVRSFAEAGDAATALELVGRAWRIWFSRGELEEGSRVIAIALAAAGAGDVLTWNARVLYADGLFAFRAGDRERSLARNDAALRIARAEDDVRGQCDALTGLARIALRDGRHDAVVTLAQQARERAQTSGEVAAEAAPLHLQAAGVRLQGDYAAARELYLESLELNSRLGNASMVAVEHHNLGWVALHLGDIDEAEASFRERDAKAGKDAYGDAWRSLNWSAVALARGGRAEAARRFEAGKKALGQLGTALDPDDKFELDWLTARLTDA